MCPRLTAVRTFIATLLLVGTTLGQPTYTVSPDTAPSGVARTIRVIPTASAAIAVDFPDCLFATVHAGGPNGAVVFTSSCPVPVTTLIPPCGAVSHSWTPPVTMAPDTYWLKCDYTDPASGALLTRWADFRIEMGSEPTLTPTDQAELGATWVINLTSPANPGAAYIAAASLSTDAGVPFAGNLVSLDQDILFFLSVPTPTPGLFTNFQGTTDVSGNATLLLHIPDIPVLGCTSIHVQAVVLSPGAAPVLTNCVDDAMFST